MVEMRLAMSFAEQAALSWGGLNLHSASTDVRDPLLSLCIGYSSGPRRKLEHRRFLAFKHISQQHGLTVWKFEGIMMYVRILLVDLPEDGHRMIDHSHL